jgi:hypothetical protein
MVSHRKISQPGWLISQKKFSQQMDSRQKNWLSILATTPQFSAAHAGY